MREGSGGRIQYSREDTGGRTQEGGYRRENTGGRIQEGGYRKGGCRREDTGSRVQERGCMVGGYATDEGYRRCGQDTEGDGEQSKKNTD